MKHTLIFSFVAVLAAACGTPSGMDAGTDGPDTECAASPAAVTMASLQTEVFEGKCKSCHYPAMGGMPAGSGFSYGDYTSAATTFEMVNKKSLYAGSAGTLKIVDTSGTSAANLANSSLWLKVSTKKTLGHKGPKGESTGSRMPNDGSAFSDAEIQKIKDWICRGAPMN